MAEQDLVRKNVEETLASLDRLERLDAGPAFFARLQARLDAGAPAPAIRLRWPIVLVPILRPALLAILVLINLLTVLFVAKESARREDGGRASVMIVAEDYSLNQNLDEFNRAGEDAEK